ncbi:MAG TPA: hypothetical protein VIK89_12550, partial [Cytophagaceae bacterium]
YKDARKIGILINNPDGDNKGIEQFVNQLQKDGKQVDVICYLGPAHRISYNFSFTPLVSNEISWTGSFKNQKINNFIKTEFDYLYSINNSPFLPFENIVVRSRAKFRIGRFLKNRKPIFDLMIDLKPEENTVQSLIDKMTAFTKKIETNA